MGTRAPRPPRRTTCLRIPEHLGTRSDGKTVQADAGPSRRPGRSLLCPRGTATACRSTVLLDAPLPLVSIRSMDLGWYRPAHRSSRAPGHLRALRCRAHVIRCRQRYSDPKIGPDGDGGEAALYRHAPRRGGWRGSIIRRLPCSPGHRDYLRPDRRLGASGWSSACEIQSQPEPPSSSAC